MNESPPPFDPDIELIDHLEGNRRSLRGYRRKAQEMVDGQRQPQRQRRLLGTLLRRSSSASQRDTPMTDST